MEDIEKEAEQSGLLSEQSDEEDTEEVSVENESEEIMENTASEENETDPQIQILLERAAADAEEE